MASANSSTDEALLRQAKIQQLEKPSRYDLSGLIRWLEHDKGGNNFPYGLEDLPWTDSRASDLIALSRRQQDHLITWAAEKLIPWFFRRSLTSKVSSIPTIRLLPLTWDFPTMIVSLTRPRRSWHCWVVGRQLHNCFSHHLCRNIISHSFAGNRHPLLYSLAFGTHLRGYGFIFYILNCTGTVDFSESGRDLCKYGCVSCVPPTK